MNPSVRACAFISSGTEGLHGNSLRRGARGPGDRRPGVPSKNRAIFDVSSGASPELRLRLPAESAAARSWHRPCTSSRCRRKSCLGRRDVSQHSPGRLEIATCLGFLSSLKVLFEPSASDIHRGGTPAPEGKPGISAEIRSLVSPASASAE